MEGKKKGLKGFLKKHIFITVIIIAFLIALSNYLVYPVFISRSLNLVSVPVAAVSINDGEMISSEMIKLVSLPLDFIGGDIDMKVSDITGKYVKSGCRVPAGSFFYSECLSERAEALGSICSSLKEDEMAYTLPVDERYIAEGSLKAERTVDIFFRCFTDIALGDGVINDAALCGIVAEDVRVIDVSLDGEIKYITLALDSEDYLYLSISEQTAGKMDGEIYPIINYDSVLTEKTSENYYDIAALRNWLLERSESFIYSEEERNKKSGAVSIIEKGLDGEIISDGGSWN